MSSDKLTFQTQELKEHLSAKVGNNLVIISTEDVFEIGGETDFGDNQQEHQSIYIFGEGINLKGALKLKNGCISADFLTSEGDNQGSFNLSGEDGQSALSTGDNKAGGHGQDGGSLFLCLGSAIDWNDPPFGVDASGGDGGNGQDVQMSLLNPFIQAENRLNGLSDSLAKDYGSDGFGQIAASRAAPAKIRAMINDLPSDDELAGYFSDYKNCLQGFTNTPSFMVGVQVSWSCSGKLRRARSKYQDEVVNKSGGKGGTGGNGGTVTVISGRAITQSNDSQESDTDQEIDIKDFVPPELYASLSTALNDAVNKTANLSLAFKRQALKIVIKTSGEAGKINDSKLKAVFSALHQAVAATTDNDFSAALKQAISTLNASQVNVSGGAGGLSHSGDANGASGTSGRFDSRRFRSMADLASSRFTATFQIANPQHVKPFILHPVQCTKLLEKAKTLYWSLDPIQEPQKVSDVKRILLQLQSRTQPFADAQDDSNLVNLYKQYEAEIGAVNSVNQFRALHQEVTTLLNQLNSGQDFFGYESSYVPLGSFKFYDRLLDKSLNVFKEIEANYYSYFDSLESHAQASERIRAARQQQNKIINDAKTRQSELEDLSHSIYQSIDSYKLLLLELKDDLTDKINSLGDKIRRVIEVDKKSILNSLSTLAFMPASGFKIANQAVKLGDNSLKKITNVKGVSVSKGYIVHKLQTLEIDINEGVDNGLRRIQEGYNTLDDGTLAISDPGAALLIAEEKQITEFLDGFYKHFPEELDALKTAFNNYISHVIARNNQILTYNATLSMLAENAQKREVAIQRRTAFNEEALKNMDPALPALVDFMSGVYRSARLQVMQTLDLTARAYRFWALSDSNSISEAYSGASLPEINSAVLGRAKTQIIEDCRTAIETFATPAQPFKMVDENCHVVDSYQLRLFKKNNILKVVIPRVTNQTDKEHNKFVGKFNVRLSLVRVWVDGAKTEDNSLTLHITHSGKEIVTSHNGDDFYFSHRAIPKTFEYDLIERQNLMEDQQLDLRDRRIVDAEDYKIKEIIATEAKFGEGNSSWKTGSWVSDTYATIGPFTTWSIFADPRSNRGLDLSGVTKVSMEFHGTCLSGASR